jgi:hypothetical protein
MNLKKLESSSTKLAIYSLLIMTTIGCLTCIEISFDIHIFPTSKSRSSFAFLLGIIFIVSISTTIISIMLNVKRAVELIEDYTKNKE